MIVCIIVFSVLFPCLLHRSRRLVRLRLSVCKTTFKSIYIYIYVYVCVCVFLSMCSDSIKDRSRRLLGMLDNRPTRQRLARLNVIKEDTPMVASSLAARREKLKRANQAIGLSNWLQHRPHKEVLMSKRIIVGKQS